MPNPKTPSTSDFSTLETQKRNDNNTLANTVPEVPDNNTGNEFEVEKRNEVYPNQSHNTDLSETEKLEKKMKDSKDENVKTVSEEKEEEEDWDISKTK